MDNVEKYLIFAQKFKYVIAKRKKCTVLAKDEMRHFEVVFKHCVDYFERKKSLFFWVDLIACWTVVFLPSGHFQNVVIWSESHETSSGISKRQL